MIRRPFFALAGLGVGAALGVWTVRRLDRATAAVAPRHVAARAGAQAGSIGRRLGDAITAGRQAAAVREAELRAEFGVPRAGAAAAAPPAGA